MKFSKFLAQFKLTDNWQEINQNKNLLSIGEFLDQKILVQIIYNRK